jgi:dolichol-phosphate mannosyltransferase
VPNEAEIVGNLPIAASAGTSLRTLTRGGVDSRGYVFQIELTYKAACAGFEIVEIPIVFRKRELGRSKMSAGIAFEARWRIPLMRLAALTGRQDGLPSRRLSRGTLAG